MAPVEPGCSRQIETTTNGQTFFIDCNDDLYWRDGLSETSPTGTGWILIDNNVHGVASNDQNEIWIIRDEDLYVRLGVTADTPLGHSWQYVFSYIKHVSSTNGFGLWVVDSRDGSVYQRQPEPLAWTGFDQDAIKLAGHWFKVHDD